MSFADIMMNNIRCIIILIYNIAMCNFIISSTSESFANILISKLISVLGNNMCIKNKQLFYYVFPSVFRNLFMFVSILTHENAFT